VNVGPVQVTYVHEDPTSGYALLEWEAPPGAASPPVHIHNRTEEGFYVLQGRFRFLIGAETLDRPPGGHALARAGVAHTLWNPDDVSARCLIVLSPPDFAPYFRQLSIDLAGSLTDEDAVEVRRRLSAIYDIEVVGPPIHP
jgi:mannose-6-phosphate isomerase-like protein (cupin superfamily)